MSFCTNCGRPVSDSARFCTNCGTQVKRRADEDRALTSSAVQPMKPKQPLDGMEISSPSFRSVGGAVRNGNKGTMRNRELLEVALCVLGLVIIGVLVGTSNRTESAALEGLNEDKGGCMGSSNRAESAETDSTPSIAETVPTPSIEPSMVRLVEDMVEIPDRCLLMGKYEVTQKQWKSVMGTNPSARKGDYLPVDSVTRGDCDQFLRKIEAYSHGVRAWLPTEAQWEYACRAGTKGEYAGEIDLMGWYAGNSENRPHPVGGLLPNAWGFCDMHGNVWELCNDLFGEDYYSKSPVNDPPGASMPSNNALREAHRKGELGSVVIPRAYVLRGGCWYLDAKDCRSSRRHAIGFGAVPEQLIGFRICCVLPGELVFSGKRMP